MCGLEVNKLFLILSYITNENLSISIGTHNTSYIRVHVCEAEPNQNQSIINDHRCI